MHLRPRGRSILTGVGLVVVAGLLAAPAAHAKTAKEIDAGADAVLEQFTQKVKGSREFLRTAKGVLVFPGVIKAGIGIGGEYGEGALRIGGRTVAYYSLAAASIGLQLGAQKKDIIIVFLDSKALADFQASTGWQVGVNGSVVLVDLGADASIDSQKANKPIVGFVIGQKGLMYNLTLEGAKISKIAR
ncbi:MAG: YSC84-related protein [Armatimonadota bacterium]|nr:YSC84-related protein [Armatimonadota bacterium]MDR7486131.1 YSC84-related protein [Armatimonadota bacterium]MDR7531762.1 YSC84-related protein [Armatimonadota bacterium]MDR7534893.1 YSC84-related protein [Armatimonadota bacterium]